MKVMIPSNPLSAVRQCTKEKVQTFANSPFLSRLVEVRVCCMTTGILIGCSFTQPAETQSASCETRKTSESASLNRKQTLQLVTASANRHLTYTTLAFGSPDSLPQVSDNANRERKYAVNCKLQPPLTVSGGLGKLPSMNVFSWQNFTAPCGTASLKDRWRDIPSSHFFLFFLECIKQPVVNAAQPQNWSSNILPFVDSK